MAKFSSFPTLLDQAKTLSITKLKEWGYLQPGQRKKGTITWSVNGNKTGIIDIAVFTDLTKPCVYLEYRYNGKPMEYFVELVSIPSNIGKGRVWYFLCPHTKKRCRNLYLVAGKFLHRDAFAGCMYESQTRSHKNRGLIRLYDRYFFKEKAFDQINSKHFKTHYAGKPTKRYVKLQEKIARGRGISFDALLHS